MVAKRGAPAKLSYPHLQETVRAYLTAGSVSGAAKILGLSRRAVVQRIDQAKAAGLIDVKRESNPSRWRPALEIIERRKAEFKRVKAAAPSQGISWIKRKNELPFMIIGFGDPHLDNPGTDLNSFEYWCSWLSREDDRTGILMGDCLDNWVKPLAYLYAESETPAPEGLVLFEHYLSTHGRDFDASVGGNHDKWNGGDELLSRLMSEKGILHRSTSLRYGYIMPSGREITLTIRHSWPGRSMWNEVHGIKRAARMGMRDTILMGGHTHVSGDSIEKDPITKKLTWCVQIASFKEVDDYADNLGLNDRSTSPAVALVIDPRRSDADPEMTKIFYNPETANQYLQAIRSS